MESSKLDEEIYKLARLSENSLLLISEQGSIYNWDISLKKSISKTKYCDSFINGVKVKEDKIVCSLQNGLTTLSPQNDLNSKLIFKRDIKR
jgi:hypothetical protein